MAKWVSSKIDIYFCDKYGTGEESSLPLLPEEFTCNIKGKNEEIDVLSVGGENNDYTAGTINLLKRPSLKTWTIDCEFSHPDKPTYENNDGEEGWTPAQWVNFFEDAMYNKKILEMTVTGINLVKEVSVEDFKHTKSAGQELDTLYTIELKEYVRSKIEHEDVKIEIVIPQPAKEIKDEVGTREQYGWLNGYGYKTGVWHKNNPYKMLIMKGRKEYSYLKYAYDNIYMDERYCDFKWLYVKILQKKEITRNVGSGNFSQLGEYITSVDSTTGYEVSNLKFLTEILSSPINMHLDNLFEDYLFNIKHLGKQARECMPGTNFTDESITGYKKCYTQAIKLKNYFHKSMSAEFDIPNTLVSIALKYASLDESKKIELAKKYLKATATSSEFHTTGDPQTDIIDMFGGKHGKMLDFKYVDSGAEKSNVTLYTLEAQQEFSCPDENINLEKYNGKNEKDDVSTIGYATLDIKTNTYEKGTKIYAFSDEILNGEIQMNNPNNNPFSIAKGELISEIKKDSGVWYGFE